MEDKNKLNEKEKIIDNEHDNKPDDTKGDVPTQDKVIHDAKTGKENFVKNENKNWKLK